jgi:predicted nucleic acid-binding protein
MTTKYRLQDVYQLEGRNVFVDANVLIYLFWPTGQHNFERSYASAFRELLRLGNPLFVDFMVVSEVVNRVVRMEHQRLNPALRFKDFRNSEMGQETLNDIYVIIRNDVLKHFKVVGKAFDKQEIESCLVLDELDFVDKGAVLLCQQNDMVLLTNDKDFRDAGIEILTGNPIILS